MSRDAQGEKSKRTPSAAALRREKTREQILESAYRALVQIGYERITTRLIAKEADCNIATLHYHFGDKETLLSEAVRSVLQRDSARIQASVAAAPTGAAALENAFQTIWEIVRERLGIVRYDLIIRGLRDPNARRTALEVYGAFRRMTEAILERHIGEGGILPPGLTVTHLAHYLISSVDGVILQYALTGDEAATRTSLSLILKNVLSVTGAGRNSPERKSFGREGNLSAHEPSEFGV